MTQLPTRHDPRPRQPYTVASPQAVRTAIAHAMLADAHPTAGDRPPTSAHGTHGDSPGTTLGSIALLPHQRDAVARVRRMLGDLHVALLADDVGMGKTFVALALAREYRWVRVIAPAALLPMWRAAIARAQCGHVRVESLQGFSRAGRTDLASHPGSLVIVDEAHHLRTPSTIRYRAVAQAVAGCDLLLMSATPLHNTPRDLRALLALALGSRANRLSTALLARAIVRREHAPTLPRIVEQPRIQVPHDPAILDAILSLPAPLPAHDGAVAGALIRLGLLRAWCSSDAALSRSLRQRLLRGEALRQALEAGRHPTAAELRSWLVGEHDVQLAFPELLARHAPEVGPLHDVLTRHLSAVERLLTTHRQSAAGDRARVRALRDIMAAHPGTPVVAFSQFAETVRAIGRALSDIAGIGTLTGRHARIASGVIARQDAIAAFAPMAHGRPPPPAHQRIRLLLTTDLLAEGVNLQDAGVVVHLDRPWTDALQRQRVGRCARLGSPHATVSVYHLEPPRGAEHALRLQRRLHRKARWAARLVGVSGGMGASDTRVARPRASVADAATAVRAVLREWLVPGDDGDHGHPRAPMVACTAAPHPAFLALVETPAGDCRLLGGRMARTRNGRPVMRVSDSPRRVLPLLRAGAVGAPCGLPHHTCTGTSTWSLTRRALQRWIARRAVGDTVGADDPVNGHGHRRLQARLQLALASTSPTARSLLQPAFRTAFDIVASARGVAAERALMAWAGAADDMPLSEWLTAWRAHPALAVGNAPLPVGVASPGDGSAYRVRAVLVMHRP